MKPATKATAIVASILIVAFCIIFALVTATTGGFRVGLGSNIDSTKSESISAGDDVSIESSVCRVRVTTDASARELTAHFHGTSYGLSIGGEPELEIVRNCGKVTVYAGRNLGGHLSWNTNLKLDIVLPADFSGSFNCQSSAGAVAIDSDMAVRSFRAHSSAGSVTARNITSGSDVEISSSAGGLEAGGITAKSLDMHTSAGRVQLSSCTADTIRLHSSGSSVNAGELNGTIREASSSAGSVTVTLGALTGDADIYSSAGSVHVTLPSGANVEIDASTSAGSVQVNDLQLTDLEQKRTHVKGKLGNGGYLIKIHSSAGSVEVNGK